MRKLKWRFLKFLIMHEMLINRFCFLFIYLTLSDNGKLIEPADASHQ